MDLATVRDDMVEGLEHPAKGVLRSEALSVAMRSVPRHEFVDVEAAATAYEDRPFEHRGTTVLAPSTVARLLEALAPSPGDRTLVVGAGVGYTTAVVAEVVGAEEVVAVDLSRPLVYDARHNLARAGYGAVLVDRTDGARGMPAYAPFDAILVEAAVVRPPRALLDQLAPEGRLVAPIGAADQTLAVIEGSDGAVAEELGPVRFGPLLVEGEQAGSVERNRARREDREMAARARQRRRGWEQDWIDWDRQL